MKTVSVVLVLVGMALFGVGMSMRTKQNAFTTIQTEVVKGNRGKVAAVGAATGAVVGGSAGAMVGGLGIAACGTGIGVPVGVVCLAAAGLCALIGGGMGLAAGTPDKTIPGTITTMVNAYSPWEYWSVIVAGCLLVSIGVLLFVGVMRRQMKGGAALVNTGMWGIGRLISACTRVVKGDSVESSRDTRGENAVQVTKPCGASGCHQWLHQEGYVERCDAACAKCRHSGPMRDYLRQVERQGE